MPLSDTMDDYSALAQRVALGVGDVPGCLILSRDGLVLGSYPHDDESLAKPAWLRFSMLGGVARSFVEFPEQIWVYAHRGSYAAFAVAGPGVRPGLLLDLLDQALVEAEEARTKRDGIKLPEAPAAPSGRPRTPMHPTTERSAPTLVPAAAAPEAAATTTETPALASSAPGPADAPAPAASPAPPKQLEPPQKRPEPKLAGHTEQPDDEAEIDRVLLAQEFAGLLQMVDPGDEGSS